MKNKSRFVIAICGVALGTLLAASGGIILGMSGLWQHFIFGLAQMLIGIVFVAYCVRQALGGGDYVDFQSRERQLEIRSVNLEDLDINDDIDWKLDFLDFVHEYDFTKVVPLVVCSPDQAKNEYEPCIARLVRELYKIGCECGNLVYVHFEEEL